WIRIARTIRRAVGEAVTDHAGEARAGRVRRASAAGCAPRRAHATGAERDAASGGAARSVERAGRARARRAVVEDEIGGEAALHPQVLAGGAQLATREAGAAVAVGRARRQAERLAPVVRSGRWARGEIRAHAA